MANTLLLKRSNTSSNTPDANELSYGELALNYNDGKLFFKNTSDVVQELLTSPGTSSGQVLFTNSSGNIAGENNLWWNATDNRLGIGTNAPSVKLDVRSSGASQILVGSSDAGSAAIILDGDSNGDGAGGDYSYIQHSTDGVLDIVQDSPSGTNEIRFGTAGVVDKLVINALGKVGIGVTAPSEKLTVAVPQASGGTLYDVLRITTTGTYDSGGSGGAGGAISFGQYFDTYPNWQVASIGGTRKGDGWRGALHFLTNDGSGQEALTEKVTIDGDGRLGIGTTSPSSPAGVGTFIHIADSSHAGIVLEDTGSTSWDIYSADGHLYFYDESTSANKIIFSAGGDVKVATHLGVGTTFSDDHLGSKSIHTVGYIDITGNGGLTFNDNASTGYFYSDNQARISAGNNIMFQAYDGSSYVERMRILTSGEVGIGTSSPRKPLHVYDASEDIVGLFQSGDAASLISFRDNSTGDDDHVMLGATGTEFALYTDNAERVRVDDSGNFGIGTSSPAEELHLKGAEPKFRIDNSSDSGKYFNMHLASGGGVSKLRFDSETHNNTLMICNNNRVGIGVGSPAVHLHIEDSVNDTDYTNNSLVGGTSLVISNQQSTDNTFSSLQLIAKEAGGTDQSASIVVESTDATSYTPKLHIVQRTGANEQSTRLTIDETGQVGIGETSPDYKFEVIGDYSNPSATAADTAVMAISAAASGSELAIGGKQNGGQIWFQNRHKSVNGYAYELFFNPQGGNVLFGSGMVGIGKSTGLSKTLHIDSTNGDASTPNGIMLANHVHGSDSQIYMYAENDSGTQSSGIIKYDPDASKMTIAGSNGTGMSIDSSGDAEFAGGITIEGGHTITDSGGDLTLESIGDDINIKGSWLRIRNSSNTVKSAFHMEGNLTLGADAQTTHMLKVASGTSYFAGQVNVDSGALVVKAANDTAAYVEIQADNSDNNSDNWRLSAETDNMFDIQTKDSGSFASVAEWSASDKAMYAKGNIYASGTIFRTASNNSAGQAWTVIGDGNIPHISIQNSGTTNNNMAGLFFKDDQAHRAGIHAKFTNHTDSSEAAQLIFSTATGGNTREKMTLDETGNLSFDGVVTSSGTGNNTFSGSILIAAGKHLFLDGGSNTYITESASDTMQFNTGGSQAMLLAANGDTTIAGALSVPSGNASIGGKLNVASSIGIGSYGLEKTFEISFANGVANQKAQIQFTKFWGELEISVSSTFSNQNAAGVVTKKYGLGIQNYATYANESRYTEVLGVTANNFAIGEITWDSTNERYYIPIVHRVSTGNTARIRVRCLGGDSSQTDYIEDLTTSSVYTTDTTAYDEPKVSFVSPIGIDTSNPEASLHVHGSSGIRLTDSNQNANEYAEIKYDNANATELHINNDWTNSNAVISLELAGSSKMTVRGDGNVGIGTTSPTHTLSVYNSGAGTSLNIGKYDTGKAVAVLGTSADTNGYFQIQSYYAQGSTFGDIALNPQGGKVGIGTTSPSHALSVNGEVRFTLGGSSQVTFNTVGGDGAMYITNSDGNAKVNFDSEGDSYLNGGNTGIGTTSFGTSSGSSSYKQFKIYDGTVLTDSGGLNSASMLMQNAYVGTSNNNFYLQSSWASRIMQTTGNITFSTASSGTADNQITWSDKFFIKNDGKVGVGTTSPSRLLTVSSGSDTYAQIETNSASNDCWIRFANTGDNTESTNFRIGRTHDGRFDIGAGDGTHHMSVMSTGKVGIGTTSPGGPLHVWGAGQGSGSNLYHQATLMDDTNAYNGNPKAGIAFGGAYNNTPSYIEFAGIMGVKSNTTHGDMKGTLRFLTNNGSNVQTTAMVINESQNVGINETSPSYRLQVNGNCRIYNSSGDVLKLLGASANTVFNINSAGLTEIKQQGDSSALKIYGYDDVSDRYGEIFVDDVGYFNVDSGGDRGLELKGHGIDFWINSGGTHFARMTYDGKFTPMTDNSYDLGALDKRWANLYVGDIELSNEGSGGNEVDGTEGKWTIQEGEEDLFLINRKSGKKYKFKIEEMI